MKKIIILLATMVAPIMAFAHVKWFVDSEEVISRSHGATAFYNWSSKEVLVWSLITIITVFIFSIIDRYAKTPKRILDIGLTHEKTINRISQVILGVFLVTVSYIWKIVIVPDMHVDSIFLALLQFFQVVIGLMFIFNMKPRYAALGLIVLCAGITLSQGVVVLLENAILLGLGVYFFIVHSSEESRVFRLNKHAVEIVRIATGVSLITLAFTEKLLYPELSLEFLAVHHWNFMQPVFPWFTNELFVLSTGFAEVIFGILFIMGYITRTTTILIALFFLASVTTMLVQFGAWEVEDLVVYSTAVLFLFYGHGKTKFFHFMWPNSRLHKAIFGK
jgi:uncharacterized membrane protein YphA (DoxX/SURF4 family)